ncbi:MAG: hypothetical protein WAN17_20270 [Candidatus Sulfotelmatobacter sp.]
MIMLGGGLVFGLEDDPQPAMNIATIQHNASRDFWIFMGSPFVFWKQGNGAALVSRQVEQVVADSAKSPHVEITKLKIAAM